MFEKYVAILLYIHIKYTVKQKPHSLYVWSNYHLMDFYCSFHDDDEQESFKAKLDSYIDLFASEYEVSGAIRNCIRYNQEWLSSEIISFCCIMDDLQYDEHSYNAIMNIISRTMRVQHIKQSSSKQSILRNSMHLHLGIELNDNKSGSSINSSNYGSDHPLNGHNHNNNNNNDTDRVLVRKWSNDSNQSIGATSFGSKHSFKDTGFSTIDEEKEHNDGYQHVDDESNISSVYINFKQLIHESNHSLGNNRPQIMNNPSIEEEKELGIDGKYNYKGLTTTNGHEEDSEDEEEDSIDDDIANNNNNGNNDKHNNNNHSRDGAKMNIAITPAEDARKYNDLHDMLHK